MINRRHPDINILPPPINNWITVCPYERCPISWARIPSIISSESKSNPSVSNSAGFLIKATEASGSQLHTVVYNIGKQFGYKFKPWQAVNIAKNIGNVAKILGPVVSVIGLLVDVKDTVDEKQRAKSVQKAQLECRQEFIDVASDLEAQYSSELSGLFTVYDDITKQLQTSRDNVQNLINADNEMTRKLLNVRNELVAIQTSIF